LSNRKSQNSILVLATLGVYFGLVLAGATPQVLASAAMTRQFDVKDEIEVKDDLDTKPDDERSPVTASVQIYLEDVEYFLASLQKLKNKGEFDPAKDTFYYSQNAFLPCVDSNIAGSYTPIRFDSSRESSRRPLENFSRGMIYGYSLGDCLPNDAFQGISATDTRFSFDLDKAFLVKVAIKKQSPQRAAQLRLEIESTVKLYSTRTATKLRKSIIRNTTFRTENDQTLVITRLPRAGLVSLFTDAAK